MRKVKNSLIVDAVALVYEPSSEGTFFVKFFCEMDIDSLVDLLEEDLDYGDENKWSFIENIRNKMEFFKIRKDTFFKHVNAKCQGCSKGLDVVVFSGNYSNVQWSIRLDVVEGKIKSVYECAKFEN
jgi:hypothetical protein|tara:strand:- start:7 stop:384 length:378 start_codon:yes stop_codon:yes gene_type:complete